MSGFISQAESIVGLIFGNGNPLYLGDFVFQAFEVPERISFGGSNDITIHRMSGSKRQIDVMGTQETDIEWSGILGISSDAQGRCETLQIMRQQGVCIPLIFGSFYYQVVIKELTFDFRKKNHIPYHIKLVVVQNQTASNSSGQLSLSQSITSDLNSAIGQVFGDGALGATVQGILSPVTSIGSVGSAILSPGSGSALTALQSLQTASQSISGLVGTANLSIQLLKSGNVSGGIAAASFLTSAGTLSNSAYGLNVVGNNIGRSINNIIIGA